MNIHEKLCCIMTIQDILKSNVDMLKELGSMKSEDTRDFRSIIANTNKGLLEISSDIIDEIIMDISEDRV